MAEVITWGMVVILTAFVLGLYSDMFIDSRDRSAMGIFLLVAGTLLLVVCVVCFTFVNQKYFEKEEYSATEYYLNRKIITVDENDTVKVDTLYSFKKRD